MRISDIIAYIGRDIEDAIIVGSIKREDIPKEITDVLGNNNSTIVDTLIKDVIQNSINEEYISFSENVYNALIKLKDWNYENIYRSKEARKNEEILKTYFYKLFITYQDYLKNDKNESNESKKRLYEFINARSDEYKNNTSDKRMIIDYIAGQTDHYFLRECEYNFKEFKEINLKKPLK